MIEQAKRGRPKSKYPLVSKNIQLFKKDFDKLIEIRDSEDIPLKMVIRKLLKNYKRIGNENQ